MNTIDIIVPLNTLRRFKNKNEVFGIIDVYEYILRSVGVIVELNIFFSTLILNICNISNPLTLCKILLKTEILLL